MLSTMPFTTITGILFSFPWVFADERYSLFSIGLLAIFDYVTRKFRIIPMSSCSRIWQW